MKNVHCCLFFAVIFIFTSVQAQVSGTTEVKKPAKYENRKLKSEKTGEKKFTLPKHIIQNTVTHYNYYFNANNRLNEIITLAKSSYKDDYSKLLTFYNYTLDATAQSKSDLDSIIYKCTAGILLHDLRNDWIDNMYMLLGKAYLYRKDFDSAAMTFQYLNFAYAPKEDGGYDVPIGSNASNENGEFSISTNEKSKKRSLWTKLTGHKPSRNESFIWQIRNHIEKDELPEAAGIIEILRHDPKFPARLKTELNREVAYWFYKQQVYDSAAFFLSKSLNEADNNQEQARWEYLVGQLYQLSNDRTEAVTYYNRSIKHTNDPVMDVYARLNAIRANGQGEKDFIQRNIDELEKMARKDKYSNYRDIIYYAAATIELDRNNTDAAQNFLLNSVKYTVNNPQQKSTSFLLLGDLNYNRKAYPESSNFYDSSDANFLALQVDKDRLLTRKPPLKIIAQNDAIIELQDSLQALAKLPQDQRELLIRKKLRALRKAQGLKEDDLSSINPAAMQAPRDLFEDTKSAEFYFYNASLKSRGFSEFKSRWGQRPNVDNWRRMASVNSTLTVNNPAADPGLVADNAVEVSGGTSFESLLDNIPSTEEKLEVSNDKIMDALFTEGKTFLDQLEDYPTAIDAFEELLRRFPNTKYKEEALFNLVYAYNKTGDLAKSASYKSQLIATSPDNSWAKLIQNPSTQKSGGGNNAATKKYEDIYNLFIEGNFAKAKQEKKAADSTYGNSYWTPQLLFIESIYYIKQQEDSTAIRVLNSLASLHSQSPMAPRALTMIDVLKRRKEIEDYLTNLDVTRKIDANAPIIAAKAITNPPVVQTPVKADTVLALPVAVIEKKNDQAAINKDTIASAIIPDVAIKKDTIAAVVKSNVAINNDTIAIAKNTIAVTTPVAINKPEIKDLKDTTATPAVAVIKPEATTPKTDSIPAVGVITPLKKDTVTSAIIKPVQKIDSSNIAKNAVVPEIKKDTIAVAPPKAIIISKNFSFVPTDPHYVVVVLDKVDPVYASEARNAFNRYNREKFSGQNIEMNAVKLDDRFNFVMQGPFSDANAAVDYIDKTQPVTRSRILPWLTAEKYSFIVISNANMELLKESKDMAAYRELIQKAFPGKF